MATSIAIGLSVDGVSSVTNAFENVSRSAGRMASETGAATGRMSTSMKELTGLMGQFGAGLSFGYLIKESLNAAMQMEKLNRQFTVFTGSAALAAKEIEFVRGEANRLGLAAQELTSSYALFMNAIKGTANEGQKGRDAFIGISEGMAAVGMQAEAQSRAWAQLNQGIMKGKFEMEDLKTINEAGLPIFKLLADALNISTEELMKMQKEGRLLANDVLPLLGESMHQAYGVAAAEGAKSAASEINKMNNAMLESKAAAGQALLPVFTDIVKGILPAIEMLKEFIGGIQILAVKIPATIDKLNAWIDNRSLGARLIGRTKEDYQAALATINANAESTIADIMKKYTIAGSDYSAAQAAATAKKVTAAYQANTRKQADDRKNTTIKTANEAVNIEKEMLKTMDAARADYNKDQIKAAEETERAMVAAMLAAKQNYNNDIANEMAMIRRDDERTAKAKLDAIAAEKKAREDLYNWMVAHDPMTGAMAALRDYSDMAAQIGQQTSDLVSDMFYNMEDALVDFIRTGKLSFKSLVDDMLTQMARILVRQQITGPLSNWMGGVATSALSYFSSGSTTGGASGAASGSSGTSAVGAAGGGAAASYSSTLLGGIAAALVGIYGQAKGDISMFEGGSSRYNNLSDLNKGGYWFGKGVLGPLDGLTGGNVFGGNVSYSGGLSAAINAGQFNAQQYTTKKTDGGWFSSDKKKTTFSELDPLFADYLASQYGGITSGIASGAGLLGGSGSLSGFSSAATKIKFPEDPAKQEEAIANYFADVTNKAIESLYANIGNYAKAGEDSAATFDRLVNSATQVNEMFTALGLTLNAVSLEGAAASDALIQALGGSQAAAQAFNSYVTSGLFTQQEQAAMQTASATAAVTAKFNELNMEIPATADAFKQLVNSYLGQGAGGAGVAAELIRISGAFALLQTTAAEVVTIDPLIALRENVDASMQVLQASINASKKVAEQKYNADIAAINEEEAAARYLAESRTATLRIEMNASQEAYRLQIAAAGDYVNTMQRVAGTLKNAFDSLIAPDAGTLQSRQSAQAAIRGYVTSGRLPMNGELDGALKVATQSGAGLFGNRVDYMRDAARTANDIKTLSDRAQGQLSSAEASLAALNAANTLAQSSYQLQIEASQFDSAVFDAQREAARQTYEAEVYRLDGIWENAEAQLSAINGTTVAVKTVQSAVVALNAEIAALRAEMAAQSAATAAASQKTAAILDKWDGDGMPAVAA